MTPNDLDYQNERKNFCPTGIDNNPLSIQVGGNHYKNFKIQPTVFIEENELSFLEGCIVKRICRYKNKGKAYEDLTKAKHEIDLLIKLKGLKDED